jgi:hypothetical protein
MHNATEHLSRRALIKLAAGTIVGVGSAQGESPTAVPLFDGKTLEGWVQIENSATSLATGGITDPAAFAGKLTKSPDAVSRFLRGRLQDSVKADLTEYSAANANAKAVISALLKDLNQIISGHRSTTKHFSAMSFRGPRPGSCSSRIHGDSNWRA